jgi:YfiH family protein
MISKNIHTIPFYFFENLSTFPKLLHFVSSRDGGTSEESHSSLNLSQRVNDNPYSVKRNRELIARSFGIAPRQLIFSSQTHEDKVAVIDSSFMQLPEDHQHTYLYGYDAMVTNLEDVCICILTADCASVLLYDPVTPAIGIAHAGWKGTVKQIAAKTIDCMVIKYGSNPQHIVAAIGPCICAESFEVGEEVAEVFEKTFNDNERIVLRKPEWIKPHIDIVAANCEILKKSGVIPENIETSGICTFQNSDIFFSARKEVAGRFGAGLMMNSRKSSR